MTYEEAIAWWYGRIDYERRSPLPGDLKLDDMRALLHLVGDPHRRVRVIHVAGSKGKGSTSAMLARILRAAGYRVGLFTSPHLCAVEERIQADGSPIARDELAAIIDDIRTALLPALTPTFFEVGTAAGFLHFVRRRMDLAVVEVGLGGRFDSTNVCDPLLSVITSISYDHTQVLGDTLGRIAFEKAGIMKPGRPVVSGVSGVSGMAVPEARAVIERIARERGCSLWQMDRDMTFEYEPGLVDDRPPRVAVRVHGRDWPALEMRLLGAHQAANAAVAIACVERLRSLGLTIPEPAVREGLARVDWPARLEVLGRSPWVVLDCAHNVASIQALVDTLAESFPAGKRWLIFGVAGDKDLTGMLGLLAPHFQHFLFTRFAQNQRGVPPEQLAERMRALAGVPCEVYATAADAWQAARTQAGANDLIVATGSVFLAGELRPRMVLDIGQSGNA